MFTLVLSLRLEAYRVFIEGIRVVDAIHVVVEELVLRLKTGGWWSGRCTRSLGRWYARHVDERGKL